jgi:hypothetical protein
MAGLTYALTVGALAGLSFYSLESILGSIIGHLPDEGPVLELSRVEKWERAEEQRPLPIAPSARPWAVSDVARIHIPQDVVREFEGTAAPIRDSGDAETVLGPGADIKGQERYRTVCVRLCDGAYFPISFATTPDRFESDEHQCQSRCNTDARLFVYRNPGQSPAEMVDRFGNSYGDLATAFIFKSSYNAACTCKSNPWEQLAEARHRLYALESRADRDTAFRKEEIAVLRETIAAQEPVALARGEPVELKSQHYAEAANGSVLDAAGAANLRPVTAALASPIEDSLPPSAAGSADARATDTGTNSSAIVRQRAKGARRVARGDKVRPRIPIASSGQARYRRYAAYGPGEIVRRALSNGF